MRISSRTFLPLLLLMGSLLGACQPPQQQPPIPTRAAAVETVSPTPSIHLASVTPSAVPAAASPTASPTPPNSLETLRGTQIHFWHPWSGSLARQITLLADEFNQSNIWGLHVIVTATGSDELLNERVQTALRSGSLPGAAAAPLEHALLWNQIQPAVIPWDEYIQARDFGITAEEIADIPANFWAQEQVNGQQLGLPALRSPAVLFYNQSWAKELGFTSPPATPEEFEKQVCAAARANTADKSRDNDGTGGWIINTDTGPILSWMQAFQAPSFTPGADDYQFASNEAAQAFGFQRSLFDKSCAWVSRNPSPYDYFARREALIYSGNLEEVLDQERAQRRAANSDEWTLLPYPMRSMRGGQAAVIVQSQSYLLFKTTPQVQMGSWLFLHWLMEPRRAARLAESAGTYPLSQAALKQMDGYRGEHPQWAAALAWREQAQTTPRRASWHLAERILQDAAWQMLQPNIKPEEIPQILKQLDETIPEVLKNAP